MTDDMEESTIANNRKAVRYISNSNIATVTLKPFFKPKLYIKVAILNISSRGARISTKYKFKVKTRVIVTLKIKNASTWRIPARIVRVYNDNEYVYGYGIVFDKIQHELVDQFILNEPDYTIT